MPSFLECSPFLAFTIPFSSGVPCYLSDWFGFKYVSHHPSLHTVVLGDPRILSPICSFLYTAQNCCDKFADSMTSQIYSSSLFLLTNSRPSCRYYFFLDVPRVQNRIHHFLNHDFMLLYMLPPPPECPSHFSALWTPTHFSRFSLNFTSSLKPSWATWFR